MLHHQRLKPPREDYPEDDWNLIEKAFHPEFMAHAETMFSLGNGYIGMRGNPEEGTPCVQNGTFVNGFYESWPIVYVEEAFGFARTGQTMLNVTDGKIIKLFVDDEPFSVETGTIRGTRTLNMKAGTLDREILWQTASGTQVQIRSRRLISFRQRHVAAISYEVTVLNAAVPVVISSEISIPRPEAQKGEGDPRKSKFTGNVLHHLSGSRKDRRVVLIHRTQRTGMILACGTDHELQTDCTHKYTTQLEEDFAQVAFAIQAQPGHPILLTKYIVYHTGTNVAPRELGQRTEWTLDRLTGQGFTSLLSEQKEFMDLFWQRSDVRASNSNTEMSSLPLVEIQQAIRVNLFHILQASARAENAGIAAKGLTGQAYEGHYFWDTEIYLLPFLTYTSPHIARNVLRFRYRMLDKARLRARELSHKGALFPWRTINGEEASAYYEAGTAQYHINADIAYAVRKYVNATGDEDFLFKYGAEILVETARLWYDLGFFSGSKGGRFCINGVTGPDEYKTLVDNNTYTNLMARENLRYAAQTIEALRYAKPEALTSLIEKTGLEMSEIGDWKRAAENMYIPFDTATGIYPQDDNFLHRKPWDFKNTPDNRYPLLLFYHPLNIYRHQVIKQADVILAMFLLGHEFSLEEKKRNFDFYDPLTTGDSSLSSSIEAVLALEVGEYDKAVKYMRAALLMDLADVGGNVKDGCHIASMGGTWMALVYGFGGLRDYDGTLSFRPQRPPEAESASLQFSLTWHGQLLDVQIDRDSTTYFLREGANLPIRHVDEPVILTRDNPRITRPTPKTDVKPFTTGDGELKKTG